MKRFNKNDLFTTKQTSSTTTTSEKEKLMVKRAKLVEKARKHGNREPMDCGKYWKREYTVDLLEYAAKRYKNAVDNGVMDKVEAIKGYTKDVEAITGKCLQNSDTYKRMIKNARKLK